jgi:hypothetical protein
MSCNKTKKQLKKAKHHNKLKKKNSPATETWDENTRMSNFELEEMRNDIRKQFFCRLDPRPPASMEMAAILNDIYDKALFKMTEHNIEENCIPKNSISSANY